MDVSINKPFKNGLRERWTEWMTKGGYTLTAGGNMRAAPLELQAKWVIESWADIKTPVITKAFKKCCISNAMDGTEDDIIWEHQEDEELAVPEELDTPDDLDTPEDLDTPDLYDDEIDTQGWAALEAAATGLSSDEDECED